MKKAIILSIDGGGIRGIIPARFLSCLENEINKKVIDIFNVYAGTSTGSIIVSSFTILEKTAQQINHDLMSENLINGLFKKEHLFDWISDIYGSKYCGDSKTKTLTRFFGNKIFNEAKYPTLITSYNLTRSSSVVFKSTGSSDGRPPLFAHQVVDCSTAAPTYFPPIEMNNNYYIDGGVSSNNPALCALSYSLSLGYPIDNIFILSIGTGKSPIEMHGNPDKWGAVQWVKNGLIDDLFDGETEIVDYNLKSIFNRFSSLNKSESNYLRINIDLEKNIELDNTINSNLTLLNKLGERAFNMHKKKTINFIENSLA
ncbi:patatin-like phospholipase family protein [Piscirickettsia salmonis]|uniref:patatin-like phospholipase family protein n=1 Tax=Piscirickettsia salmonis TaxID=1238 RepID=UPI0007C9588E|nr:Patatin-like phospholipase [Piscirickettsiaceae bacterium NZ-RLO1]